MKPKVLLWQGIIRPYGFTNDPNWDRIELLIDLLPQQNGIVNLERRVDERTTDKKLRPYDNRYDEHYVEVRADRGQYLITYFSSERDKDEDGVYAYDHPSIMPGQEMVEILGDYWDASIVSTDLEIVRKAFKEFYDTGNFWMENFFET
ncbi:DUF6911 family protein [Profundibacter sp.]